MCCIVQLVVSALVPLTAAVFVGLWSTRVNPSVSLLTLHFWFAQPDIQAWALWAQAFQSIPLERLCCADKVSDNQEIPCLCHVCAQAKEYNNITLAYFQFLIVTAMQKTNWFFVSESKISPLFVFCTDGIQFALCSNSFV